MKQKEDNPRPNKIPYYLRLAHSVCHRSTCLRRMTGAVFVKNDSIVSTGYNGAPRGRPNCCDVGKCPRENFGIGKRLDLCIAVHAEDNAIINAAREGNSVYGSDLYLATVDAKTAAIVNRGPCDLCWRHLINAGISRVFVLRDDGRWDQQSVSMRKEN